MIRSNAELGQVPILETPIDDIKPSPENDELYRPIDPTDLDILALAKSIRKHGVREPIVITKDGWIISGHRRYAAAILAGLKSIPCRIEDISREDDHDQFLVLLREYNRQRIKSLDEVLREEVVSCDPEEAYASLIEYREEQAELDSSVDVMEIGGPKQRAKISKAKEPFLSAIRSILKARSKFWPLCDRSIHYALLNDPPLTHASKPDSTYSATVPSYKKLCELLTRARLAGRIPMKAIADKTRPVTTWKAYSSVQPFIGDEVDSCFKGYYRDVMQSQPNHIEIVGEKNTIESIIRPVAMQYRISLTIGRGFCSLPPRAEMASRFRRSGKEKLVLLIVSDFDPEGEQIAESFARSMRDDFGIDSTTAIKVALTADQVEDYGLQPQLKAKRKSVNYKKFVEKYGTDVFELEALEPDDLQELLSEAIDSNAFNAELDSEKEDAEFLENTRRRVAVALKGVVGDDAGGDDGD